MRYLVGIGTYAAMDDSIGLRVAEAIAAEGLDEGFTAIDLGGNLLDVLHYLDEGVGQVLVVDAARMGREPGEYALFALEHASTRKKLAGFSTHEDDLLKALELGTALGQPLPPITVLGIEPADVSGGMGLSPTLEARFREYVEAAVGFFGA